MFTAGCRSNKPTLSPPPKHKGNINPTAVTPRRLPAGVSADMFECIKTLLKKQKLTGMRSAGHFNLDGSVRQEALGGVSSHSFSLTDRITVLDRKDNREAAIKAKTINPVKQRYTSFQGRIVEGKT